MTLNTATINLAQQIQTPALTTFSKLIAIITEPTFLLALTIILSIFLYIKKQKTQATLLALTSIFTALTIAISKSVFKISRPTSMLIQETGYSFPSGQTTFAVVFFGLITYIFAKQQYKIPATTISIILITIIASTRLYLQVHWLTDIIAGAITGTTILILSILIHKKLN